MKKYYLYRKPLQNYKGDWFFDDEFNSYDDAWTQARINARNASWKIWKIEEVWDFSSPQDVV